MSATVGAADLDLPFGFINRCRMEPGGGVAEHFHNTVEEMFTILDGEGELTVDGRTSAVKGTVGAPCRLGHAHAVYNPTNGKVDYMNINVPVTRGTTTRKIWTTRAIRLLIKVQSRSSLQ